MHNVQHISTYSIDIIDKTCITRRIESLIIFAAGAVGGSGQRGIHAPCFKLSEGSQRESQRLRTGLDSSAV